MSQIFITNEQKEEALGHIRYRNVLSNSHKKSLEDGSETFEFVTYADQPYSSSLEGMNRTIIPGEDGEFLEFIIYEVQEDRLESRLEVHAYASYVELIKAKSILPHTTLALSAEDHATEALSGTRWQVGIIAFNGVRTIVFENYTNPYAYLKKIASEFDLELNFRVEHVNGKITGRYVDLVEKVGEWRGRRVEFGKDLLGLRRIENTDNIVTALRVLGPIDTEGNRLQIIVEDEDALQRWGIDGQHIIDTYEPQITNTESVTVDRLKELGERELSKRINASVTYEGTIADLEKVPGLEHKKIRFGDTIQIKDTSYEPALYLEARIFFQDRDITDQAQKQVRLGDFIEYTEEEVNAIWKSLQEQIRQKIGMSELEEVTYTKPQIDGKDDAVREEASKDAQAKTVEGYLNTVNAEKEAVDKRYLAIYSSPYLNGTAKSELQNAKIDYNTKYTALVDEINRATADGETTPTEKSTVDAAFNNYRNSMGVFFDKFEIANDFITQTKAQEAENNANSHTDQIKQQLDAELLEKAGLEYVDEQLTFKADSDVVNTINNTVDNLQQLVDTHSDELEEQGGKITTVETELDDVEGKLSVAITDLSTLEGTVSSQGTQIDANTKAISFKAERSELETLEGNVTNLSNEVGELTISYNGISAEVSDLEATVDGHTVAISDHTSSINVLSNEINSKVSETYVDNAIADIEIGARNLAPLSSIGSWGTGGFTRNNYQFTLSGMNSGLYIHEDQYEPVTEYVMSFKVKKTSGSVHTMAGHSNVADASKTKVYRDGVLVRAGNWSVGDQSYPNDNGEYEYMIKFTTRSDIGTSNDRMYIQPNRSEYDQEFTVVVWDLQLEKGNKKTQWQPAPEDVQSNIDSVYSYAESEITQLSTEIQSKVGKTEFDNLTGRVSSAESTITQHSNQIATKVEEDGVISAINQTPESIRIQASKLNLVGAVTVLSDITGKLGTITAGTINGVTINGSTLNSRVDSNNYTTIENNSIHSEGIYYSDWAKGNQKGVFDVNDGLITMKSGSTNLSTYGQAQISQFGLAVEHYNNGNLNKGTYISPDGIGFNNWWDSSPTSITSGGSVFLGTSFADSLQLTAQGRVFADSFVVSSGYFEVASYSRSSYGTGAMQSYYDANAKEWKILGRTSTYGSTGITLRMISGNVHVEELLRVDGDIRSAGYSRGWGSNNVYLQPSSSGSVLVTSNGYNGGRPNYRPITASSFTNGSLEEYKQDIRKLDLNASELINQATIYEYYLKSDVMNGVYKQRYGLIIGDGYNTPQEVVDGDGVDQYAMNSLSWKAIQELMDITDGHADDINFLKMENQYLKGKVKELEAKIA
ncbi:phage tail spike protein [Gracilibacillus dipsosauri]|uniref:phage tail spike protein n=1 Tax=Gracilibacillus dipsosauri TaxID=178340 RepID=UPI001FE633C2|nr:phage tail spike protein [Gracilibacillus dipsosauri]